MGEAGFLPSLPAPRGGTARAAPQCRRSRVADLSRLWLSPEPELLSPSPRLEAEREKHIFSPGDSGKGVSPQAHCPQSERFWDGPVSRAGGTGRARVGVSVLAPRSATAFASAAGDVPRGGVTVRVLSMVLPAKKVLSTGNWQEFAVDLV